MSAIELPLLRSPSEEAARVERNAQTLAHANANVAGYDESSTIKRVESDAPETKKSPQASIKNYFVCNHPLRITRTPANSSQRVFLYGTKLDYFLVSLCCFTSIGAGTAMPLMNIVFGML
jgi:ATP-binding cassette subfamily B (MDR/TAP) protein 1